MLEEKNTIPPWKIRFWSFLYKCYSSNSGANGILRYRITPLGYLVAIGLVLTMTLRLGSSNNVLFSIISFLATLLLVAFIAVLFRKSQLKVKRYLPKMATVDVPLKFTLQVENKSALPVKGVFFREINTPRMPSKEVFVHSVEPGEKERNAFDRLFILYRWQWLTDSRQGFRAKDSAFISLKGKESKQLQVQITPTRRGMTRVGNLRAMLPDPFCLFQRCRIVEQEEDHVLILPKRYKINSLNILGEARNQVGGEAQSRNIGQSSEFVSLRDYRPGDPIKNIDWKSWAKTGEPIVREYEDVYYPRHGLVLDTCVHPTLFMEFEEAISVASSFASSMDTNEQLLDLVMLQQDAKVITVGKDVARVEKMLEALACAEIESDPNWQELTKKVLQMTPDFSACIMVFADWSKERAELVNKTLMLGCKVLPFLIVKERESAATLLQQFQTGTPLHLLEINKIQQGLNVSLKQ